MLAWYTVFRKPANEAFLFRPICLHRIHGNSLHHWLKWTFQVNIQNGHQITSSLMESESREEGLLIPSHHSSHSNPRKSRSHLLCYLISFTPHPILFTLPLFNNFSHLTRNSMPLNANKPALYKMTCKHEFMVDFPCPLASHILLWCTCVTLWYLCIEWGWL